MEKSVPKVDYSHIESINPPKEFKLTAVQMEKLRKSRGKYALQEKKK